MTIVRVLAKIISIPNEESLSEKAVGRSLPALSKLYDVPFRL